MILSPIFDKFFTDPDKYGLLYHTGPARKRVSHPGGCEIGPRPIDLHIKALKMMGVKISDLQHGQLYCEADKLRGCEIQLDYPSVGATENIMLAGILAEGTTYIRNAAKEPEICDLQKFLNEIGADISGAGSSVIKINGGSFTDLHEAEHMTIPDRIVAGTYLVAAAATKSTLTVTDVIPDHITSVLYTLRESGCVLNTGKDYVKIMAPQRLHAIDTVRTHPYPGFPTDMQAQVCSMLTVARGTSIVVETVFENRFKHIDELIRMGAKVNVDGRVAVIYGVKNLTGANVQVPDLRGGAALIIAGLAAQGETMLSTTKHIDRGYEKIEEKLASAGASIQRVE